MTAVQKQMIWVLDRHLHLYDVLENATIFDLKHSYLSVAWRSVVQTMEVVLIVVSCSHSHPLVHSAVQLVLVACAD